MTHVYSTYESELGGFQFTCGHRSYTGCKVDGRTYCSRCWDHLVKERSGSHAPFCEYCEEEFGVGIFDDPEAPVLLCEDCAYNVSAYMVNLKAVGATEEDYIR